MKPSHLLLLLAVPALLAVHSCKSMLAGSKSKGESYSAVLNTGGDVVSVRGDTSEVVAGFRIPALVTTSKGTLIAAYDVRYKHYGDLQADIDVGVRRSTDGGRTWSPLSLAMDMGRYGGLPESENGIGDPCLLVDDKTGDVFCFAVWTHGHGSDYDRRSLAWAGTGFEIIDTPQLMMVRSTDDGLTWSEPVNLTRQIKQEGWRMTFQGPGRGITMADGTLVIPIQHQEGESRSMHGLYPLNSGIAYSKDHGRTWTEHVSNGKLFEPTCQASLLYVKAKKNCLRRDILLFSNPQTETGWRDHMTIQASLDKGATWTHKILVDPGGSLGYSCLTMVDRNTVGILYEGSTADIVFQAIPLSYIIQ